LKKSATYKKRFTDYIDKIKRYKAYYSLLSLKTIPAEGLNLEVPMSTLDEEKGVGGEQKVVEMDPC